MDERKEGRMDGRKGAQKPAAADSSVMCNISGLVMCSDVLYCVNWGVSFLISFFMLTAFRILCV